MLIAISGTPATGKTSVSRLLAKSMKANLVSISSLVKSRKVKSRYDAKRKTFVVDENEIKKAVKKLIKPGNNIVEGHVAHILKADKVVILRCSPPRLIVRMKKKGWGTDKIRENIEAEMLDAITVEALETHRKSNVIEIDTSTHTVKQIATLVKNILATRDLQKKYRAGSIDWTEKYKKYFSSHDYDMSA